MLRIVILSIESVSIFGSKSRITLNGEFLVDMTQIKVIPSKI